MKVKTSGISQKYGHWVPKGHPREQEFLAEAKLDYRKNRENGADCDNPAEDFPGDGEAIWVSIPRSACKLEYKEGPGDKNWMLEKDRNYLARLYRENRLEEAYSKLILKNKTWGKSDYHYPARAGLYSSVDSIGNKDLRTAALKDYRVNRENGEVVDNPKDSFPHDGVYKWERTHDGYVYVQYKEGPGDKNWMLEKDQNYLAHFRKKEQRYIKRLLLQKNIRPWLNTLMNARLMAQAQRSDNCPLGKIPIDIAGAINDYVLGGNYYTFFTEKFDRKPTKEDLKSAKTMALLSLK